VPWHDLFHTEPPLQLRVHVPLQFFERGVGRRREIFHDPSQLFCIDLLKLQRPSVVVLVPLLSG